MKFGIFMLMQSPDMLSSSEVYANAIEQAKLADELGFDYVVAAEHHFSSYGFLPNPLMLISTLAQHTRNVRFSTAVVVLPLRNPIHTAEEIAMLDHLTNGRLEVGFGTGYQEYEFQRFQRPLEENRLMFEESLDVIYNALTHAPFSHEGRYYQIPETTILPRPLQQPHPPFWRATSSVESMASALKRGMNVITGGTSGSTQRVIKSWNMFQEAVGLSGKSWPQEFIVQRGVYVTDSEEDAKAQLPHAVWHTRSARGLRTNTLRVDAGKARTDLTPGRPDEDDPEFLYNDWLFGTPESVAEKVHSLIEATGMTYLNCTFSIGQIPHKKVLRSMELFATEVMPRFRNHQPDQAKYSLQGQA
ncbi:MAG: LLM class flavin-dependent oxidoreductase [Chloroflexota bacterium]|nr:LLM class flavin-dependent oxidoreductase [Chloroflexota bacterium]